ADLDQRDQGRERSDPVARQRRRHHEERSRRRQDDQDRRQPVIHQRAARKTTVSTARPPASASAYERTRPFCAVDSSREPSPTTPVTAVSEPAISGRSTTAASPRVNRSAPRYHRKS